MGSKSRNRTEQKTNNNATNIGLTTEDGSIINGDGNTQIDQSGSTFDSSDNSVSTVDNSDNSVTTVDNSDNSVTTVDNSDNSVLTYDLDQSDNSVTDIDQSDNSVTSIDESQHYNGEYAGITGNVTVTDGGAFEVVETAMDNVLAAIVDVNGMSSSVANTAINSIEDVATTSNTEMAALAQTITETSVTSVTELGDTLVTKTINALSTGSQQAVEAATDAMDRNAKLIQTNNLQGQDLIAEQAVTMTKYVMGGLIAMASIGGVFYVITKRKQS